jgi:hypothetical protein
MNRRVTSAIDGMSVAEVRRALDVVRKGWSHEAPFHLTGALFNGMTHQQFCMELTLGHHTKRHAKSKHADE